QPSRTGFALDPPEAPTAALPRRHGGLPPLILTGLILLTLGALAAGATDRKPKRGLEAPAGRASRALERMDLRDLLGRERWRQLKTARFRVHLGDLDFTPELPDDPAAHDEVAHILLRSLLKGSQEAVERRLRLEERRDAPRDRLRGRPLHGDPPSIRPQLAASPRIHLDHELWLGAKLYLRGTRSSFWSYADLRLGSELDGGNPSVKLAFHDHARHGFVSYHPAHPERGETIELRIGLTF
ncbi:MAG: hypothetical protein ACE5EG_08575, partial [Thermoanaerobaculia bacterium]